LSRDSYAFCDAFATALSAMALEKLGRHEEALADLAQSRKLVNRVFQTVTQFRGYWETGLWHDWLIARTFLREAEALIDPSGERSPGP
jgi:hypothetical protein